jgi:hypothetical protein
MNTSLTRALAFVLLVAGCASAAQQPGSSGGDRNVLTRDQLAATNSSDVYGALEKLRPEWLTSRGPTSVTNATPVIPSVFMNGQMLGKTEQLRDMRILEVSEVRFWPTGQAAAKFGMGHPRGVIEIILR